MEGIQNTKSEKTRCDVSSLKISIPSLLEASRAYFSSVYLYHTAAPYKNSRTYRTVGFGCFSLRSGLGLLHLMLSALPLRLSYLYLTLILLYLRSGGNAAVTAV